MGGLSSEHDVSLVSGTNIIKNLNERIYDIYPVIISKRNVWTWTNSPLNEEQIESFEPELFANAPTVGSVKAPALSELPSCDMAFLALHGKFGEDGRIQALLEFWDIPYTGSGVLGSALAMDKIKSKEIYEAKGIKTPRWKMLEKNRFQPDDIYDLQEEFGETLVIKDPVGGSSLGLAITHNTNEAFDFIEMLFESTDKILIEEYLQGREGTCGYISNYNQLPPTEIIPQVEFFDYEAKYNGKTQEVTPGNFPSHITAAMQELAEQCHKALSLDVYSRTDFLLVGEELYVLETNTLPGMTGESLLPQAARAAGLVYSKLLDVIINGSERKYGSRY